MVWQASRGISFAVTQLAPTQGTEIDKILIIFGTLFVHFQRFLFAVFGIGKKLRKALKVDVSCKNPRAKESDYGAASLIF